MIFSLRTAHHSFWRETPALLLGLSLLFGSSSFLFWAHPWNYIFPFLWSSYLVFVKKTWVIVALFCSFFYSWSLYHQAPVLTEAQKTTALFSIHSLQAHHSPFQKGLVYKGTISLKEGSFPCSIYHRGNNAPKASHDYLLEGSLKQRAPYDYLFFPKKWTPVKNSYSLAEVRYQLKESLRKFLQKHLSPRTAVFLGSLITGDVEDRQLRYEFGKLGLQHILAVSGFHFGILITFCSLVLSFALPRFWKYLTLIAAINIYFCFIGALPAVQRSWLAAQLYFIGKLFKRETTPLNLLGCALTLEMCLNPLICSHIGFQLSFTSCAGILLLYPLFQKQLRAYLPHRKKEEILELTIFSKHAYCLSSFLRKTISLTLAVQCAIAPLLLYHFHELPLLGFFYNLFFPFFVAMSISLLLLSLSFELLLPPLAPCLFKITDWITTHLLDLSSYPPSSLDYSLLISSLPAWIIPLYLGILFALCLSPAEELLPRKEGVSPL